ncbi:hypothetical protein M9458_003861, partial [Cirrhinus mrigala]
IIPVYGMNYIGRDEQYKPPPKKMKDRLERQNRLNSPPSIYKSSMGCNHMYNGYGKVHGNLGVLELKKTTVALGVAPGPVSQTYK